LKLRPPVRLASGGLGPARRRPHRDVEGHGEPPRNGGAGAVV